MKTIAIAFTLKGQSFDDIKKVLMQISEQTNGKSAGIVLVHGFMPREEVIAKGFGTEVVDALDELFTNQHRCYSSGMPQREEMAGVLKEQNGWIYVIGDIVAGVKEEVDIYTSAGLSVHHLPLGFVGAIPTAENTAPKPISEGEFRVRTDFNVSNDSRVGLIKQKSAELINLINGLEITKEMPTSRDSASFGRLKSLAMTEIESGCSWAVKAATV